jgi:hypothetical protein
MKDAMKRACLTLLVIASAGCTDKKYAEPPADSYVSVVTSMQRNGVDTTIATASIGPTFLQAAGVRPLLGRAFIADEYTAPARVLMISENLWRAVFGADPSLIGRPLTVNGGTLIVVGVMPKDFDIPPGTGLYLPRSGTIAQ